MSIISQTHGCDAPGCTEQHSGTNGWYAVMQDRRGGIHIYPWVEAIQDGILAFARVYCGEQHLLQYISTLMGGEPEPVGGKAKTEGTKA
jgi:hypothetical protein